MDDTCVVCAETLEWVAYGSCGHREVCSTCVARLRFICNDRRCCLCKFESSTVFVTKALGEYTNVIKDFSTLPSDPTEGRAGPYWYHEGTHAYFDDSDHYKMIKATCKLTCSECDKENGSSEKYSRRRGAFAGIEKLKDHLFHQHKLSMCNLCLEGRKVFICEQKLFTRAQLGQHISTGDSEVDGSESERGGFKGHPSCQFCRNHFYGDNELYLHMSTEHYTCHICLRRHPGQYDYYDSYNDLENHFRADHFLCEDEACLTKKFVVFASESEMKRHNAMDHGGQMSRYQRNAALQIPVSFQFRETSEQERRRRRRGSHFNLSENRSLVQMQATNQLVNVHAALVTSSDAIVASNHQNTLGIDTIVGHFVTVTTSDPTPQISSRTSLVESSFPPLSGHMSLEQSSFPPLPTIQGSSQRKSKNKSGKPTMAAHLRHQSNLSPNAAQNSSRASALANHHGSAATNSRVWPTTPISATSHSKAIAGDKCRGSALSSNVQLSRPLNNGSLTIGSASSNNATSSVTPIISGGRSVNMVPIIPSALSQLKGKSPMDSQHSVQTETSQLANKNLVERIRAILQFDNDKYASFKMISMQFRQGLIDSGEYLLHVHQFGLSDLVPDLARLLPDSTKQKELIDTYNFNFKRNGFHKDGVGQDTSQLMRSRKGKEKCQDNGVSSSEDGSSAPGVASSNHLLKEARGAHHSMRSKSKVLLADEEGSKGVIPQTHINGRGQTQSGAPTQISELDVLSKKLKKKSKFLRARLGDSCVEAPEQQDSHGTPLSSQAEKTVRYRSSSAATGPGRGAWVNGGGRKLVANLNDTKRAAQK
uniref:RING-type E3 ubiquitin transferase n=1 Tax=Kalanchoe fedtschenkoi TaxID=63787 RepID=A0A7N0UAI5_KALFE